MKLGAIHPLFAALSRDAMRGRPLTGLPPYVTKPLAARFRSVQPVRNFYDWVPPGCVGSNPNSSGIRRKLPLGGRRNSHRS